jgi:hypothetical protein
MDELVSAGASSLAEYQRRRAVHSDAVRRRRPWVLGIAGVMAVVGLALMGSQPLFGWSLLAMAFVLPVNALFMTPGHITAWGTGADGEARTGRFLEPLRAEGFFVLHDRRIPGSRANIDHIVIGPPGVFVVETKSFGGSLKVRGNEVYVAGRRRTGMIDEAKREALAVQVALATELETVNLPVVPVICVHRADLPSFGSQAGGVRIASGKELVKRLRKAEPRLQPDTTELLAKTAASRLRPAAAA